MSRRVRVASLEEVLQKTQVVLCAALANPSYRLESIPIAPKQEASPERFPAFTRCICRYLVEEVISSSSSKTPKPGEEIEVSGPAWRYELAIYKKRYLEGLNKITLHTEYRPTGSDGALDNDKLILFLRYQSRDGWTFAYPNSVEHPQLRPKVEALLQQRRPRR